MTALALCKLNKNEMYTGRLSKRMRHEHTSDLFWRYEDVPEEALAILQASTPYFTINPLRPSLLSEKTPKDYIVSSDAHI